MSLDSVSIIFQTKAKCSCLYMCLQSTGPGQHGVPGVTVPVDVEKVLRSVPAPAPTLTPSMAVQYVRETRRRDDLVPASVQVSPFVGILLWGN